MEIKDRLLKIISSEGLNSSAFADSIGVQRSSISHILSGRNKPSIDFLEKILSSYPKYNAEWLIMGTGEITKTPKQATLFEQNPLDNPDSELKESKTPLTEPISPMPRDAAFSVSSGMSQSDDEVIKDEHQESYAALNTPKNSTNKAIDRIVIFYSDHTFIDYKPGK